MAITVLELTTKEPRLRSVFAEARAIAQTRRAEWSDYSRLKQSLSRFVGWNATNETLATSEAYEVAIKELADSLRI